MITFSEPDVDYFIEVRESGAMIGYVYRGMMGWWWKDSSLNTAFNAKQLQQILDKVKAMNELTGEVEW